MGVSEAQIMDMVAWVVIAIGCCVIVWAGWAIVYFNKEPF
jgi:hypothetical protein